MITPEEEMLKKQEEKEEKEEDVLANILNNMLKEKQEFMHVSRIKQQKNPKIVHAIPYKPTYPKSHTVEHGKNPYVGQYFKLQEFKIKTRYKNLEDFYVDFRNMSSYCVFIGLNGSGKSNVIEALSAVFYSLYRLSTLRSPKKSDQCPFEYAISYILNEKLIEIEDGKAKDGAKITPDILPRNVIVNYSGEEERLWRQYYEPLYLKFCRNLTDEAQRFEAPKMLYIDRHCWGIALLTLLCAEADGVKSFLKSLFDTVQSITFEYNASAFHHWEQNFTKIFVDELRKKELYTLDEFKDFVQRVEFIDSERTLFLLLYQAIKQDNDQLISDIHITFANGSDIEGLSEGEKKLIIVFCILHSLASETSLVMFDEPDSHIHISRKEEIKDIINTENRYSIVTTHSPVFVNCLCDENIRFLKDGKIEDLERCKKLSLLSGGSISIFEGSLILGAKKILVTEGPYDKKYLEKAISIFAARDPKYKKLKQVTIIPAGSAGNAKAMYDDVLSKQVDALELIVFLFDYDKGGLDGWKSIAELKSGKIIPIFYQDDYTKEYITERKDIGANDSYMVEDLFSPESYKEKVEYIHKKNTHKEFRCNDQGKTTEAIKKHIENHYSYFKDEWFEGFKPVLDQLISIFQL